MYVHRYTDEINYQVIEYYNGDLTVAMIFLTP